MGITAPRMAVQPIPRHRSHARGRALARSTASRTLFFDRPLPDQLQSRQTTLHDIICPDCSSPLRPPRVPSARPIFDYRCCTPLGHACRKQPMPLDLSVAQIEVYVLASLTSRPGEKSQDRCGWRSALDILFASAPRGRGPNLMSGLVGLGCICAKALVQGRLLGYACPCLDMQFQIWKMVLVRLQGCVVWLGQVL